MVTSTRSRRSSEVPTPLPPVQEMTSSSSRRPSSNLIDVSKGGRAQIEQFCNGLCVQVHKSLLSTSTPSSTTTQSKRVNFSETPTETGSSATPPLSQDSLPQEQQDEQQLEPLPLWERLPNVEEVLLPALCSDKQIKNIFSTPNVFDSEQERHDFFVAYFHYLREEERQFWDIAMEYVHDAIDDNKPECRNHVKSCKDEYVLDIDFMVREHFATRIVRGYRDHPRLQKLLSLSNVIGWRFIDIVESLISPPKGPRIVSIPTQLEKCINDVSSKVLSDYFEPGVEQHVYYIAGYLCHAGKTAASRQNNSLCNCIGAVSAHFVSTESEVDRVKRDLPDGLADLVDKSAVHRCLSYPNLRFYSLIAKIEYCYSNLSSVDNLRTFGGEVLATICDAIVANESFTGHFASLFDERQFDDATMKKAFSFYIK
eukprot:scaffold249326_cov50-Cyclotella_meneghiniana.AAC.1